MTGPWTGRRRDADSQSFEWGLHDDRGVTLRHVGDDGDAAVEPERGERAGFDEGDPSDSKAVIRAREHDLHLHVLTAHGVRCVNGPRALERTVDKSWAGALLADAGVPTPPTIVCEQYSGAMDAFERLGGDVVVKPLFGAMGNGIVRVEDRDVAHRVFRALELERTVYYVQRTLAPAGRRDLRVLVVGNEIAGAMERVTDLWRANIARGARPRLVALSEAERDLALSAAAALQADIAGVDLLVSGGESVVVEVNGIPGWQALQSICADDLAARVVNACEALVTA